jgi:hypothetical protein
MSRFSARLVPFRTAGIMSRFSARLVALRTAGIMSRLLARLVPGKHSRFRRRSKSSRGTDRPRSTRILRAKPPPQIYAFIERGEIETVVIGRSRRGKTRSRQAAAPWAEGLRPIPGSQPENKNSPRQLESEAGLSSGIPRRFRGDSRRGGPPSIGEPCWTTTMCCLHNCVTPSFTSGASVKST